MTHMPDTPARELLLAQALCQIWDMPPGSRGGYGKFREAQRIARNALVASGMMSATEKSP